MKKMNKKMNSPWFALPVAWCMLAFAAAPADELDDETRLLAVLESEVPAGPKARACYQLKQVGTERSIPVLAALLADPALAHPARYALESMPYPEVDAALREALGRVGGNLQAGVAITMGRRACRESVPALAQVLTEAEPCVAAAAAGALGRIGGEGALAAVEAAWQQERPPQVRWAVGDAMARLAEQRLAAGDADGAVAIFRQLAEAGAPRPLRMAGLLGLLRCAGEEAATEVLAMLRGDDALARQMAAAHIAELPADALPRLAEAAGELPAAQQELLLDALAARRAPSLLPAALAAAQSETPSLRLAGLRALSAVGDGAAVGVLAAALRAGGQKAETARWSLVGLRAEGVDEALAGELERAGDPAGHAALVDVLVARQTRSAVPLLTKQALADGAAIRGQAMAGLAALAGPGDVGPMVRAMLKAEDGRARDEAERAIMRVCERIADPARRAAPVLEAIAETDDASQVQVLPLLGRIGGPEALKLIRRAMQSERPALREAGVRALCNWPTDAVADDLKDLAGSAPEPSHRIWSLRALIRVITLPEGRPRHEKLAVLKEAMELATRDDERKLALVRSPALRGLDTFRWVRPYLDDASLRQEACLAVVEMAHHRELREPNAAEFDAALKRVIDLCEDAQLVERAKNYLSGR